jgi:hypothetical protein
LKNIFNYNQYIDLIYLFVSNLMVNKERERVKKKKSKKKKIKRG